MKATRGSSDPERVDGGFRWATLPNALSAIRMVFLVPILWLLESPAPNSDGWATVLLVVAGLSDLLDGWLARRRSAISPSGKVVDPFADKVLLGGLIVYLAATRGFPIWLVGLVILRDALLIGGAWLFFRRERVVFSADWTGKLTTFFLGLLTLAHILQWKSAYTALTVAASVMLALSYISYGSRAWRWRSAGRA